MKILVSGSIAYDKIMNFPGYFKDHILPNKIHNINVSFFIEKVNENFGGTAGNIAYNLALLDERSTVFSAIGNDFTPYKEWLLKHKIDLNNLTSIDNDRTALATIITDKTDNQISAFCPGAMLNSSTVKYKNEFKDSFAIVAPGLMEDMIYFSKFYTKHKIPYIFDPGQQIPVLDATDLKYCIENAKIFVSNDYELSMVLKKTGYSEEDIINKVEILVTTLGEQGSIIKTKNETLKIKPAKPKSITDPTGAGDAYRAGLIKGIINDWPLQTTGEFAGVISCYAIENHGTQNHKFDFNQTKKRYEENFNKSLA
ncbi:MAG: carbohydrate kinase family protein [Patescibacteria group bacterium]|nr:carbohydrate kinase family protein [Patescibacteria group bacterium]